MFMGASREERFHEEELWYVKVPLYAEVGE